jgi:uroporphyrin-III C-methyltransferase
MTMAKVIFIGAGPGAADLITVRGARLLALADVVLFDALTDPALRDLAPNARWVDVGKRGFCDSTGQATINALLVKHANEVGTVVRLKGGDPNVFGRLEEELEALAQNGIACEVVPGVTAALAAAASSQRPLTRRGTGRSISLATAMTRTGDLHATRSADTEVFYMAGKQLAALSRQLIDAGWPAQTPASVVSRAGWPDALHSDHCVQDLAQASLLHAGRPTIVTVGAGARALNTPIPRACTAPGETLKPLKCEASPVGETPSSVTSSKQEP